MHKALIVSLVVALACALLTFVLARIPSVSLDVTMFIYGVEKVAIIAAVIFFVLRMVLKRRRAA